MYHNPMVIGSQPAKYGWSTEHWINHWKETWGLGQSSTV